MSVLIKMNMPKEKAIAVVIHPDGTAYTAEMTAGVCTEYLADRTAIEVPAHGRLIDADALIEDLKYDVELNAVALDSMEIVGDERRKIQDDKDFKQNCIFWIENATTVIPAEKGK